MREYKKFSVPVYMGHISKRNRLFYKRLGQLSRKALLLDMSNGNKKDLQQVHRDWIAIYAKMQRCA